MDKRDKAPDPAELSFQAEADKYKNKQVSNSDQSRPDNKTGGGVGGFASGTVFRPSPMKMS